MSRTGAATWSDLQDPRIFRVGAHRGGRDLGPENTVETAELGFQAGASFWELDVQLTADGVPVVLHDETLERTTDAPRIYPNRRPWRIADFLWDELAPLRVLCLGSEQNFLHEEPAHPGSSCFQGRSPRFEPSCAKGKGSALMPQASPGKDSHPVRLPRLGDKGGGRGAVSRIPSLRRALEWTRARGRLVNVEIKGRPEQHERLVRETIALVRKLSMLSHVLLSSFHHEVLRRAKALEPRLMTGVLLERPVPDPIALVRALGADAVHPAEASLGEEMVRRCRAAGVPVIAWTVNDPERAKQLKLWGVSAVITDRPHCLVTQLDAGKDPL